MPKLCKQCGGELQPDNKFCSACGFPAPEEVIAETINQHQPPIQQQSESPSVSEKQQGSYTPPAPVQGGYTPPAQDEQKTSYTPPVQQQGPYTPPAQQGQGSYTPPAQSGYQAPAGQNDSAPNTYGVPQGNAKQRIPFTLNKKTLMFGGIAVAILILLIGMITMCGKSDDAYLGKWKGTTVDLAGYIADVEEVWGGEVIFEINRDGTCILTFGEDVMEGMWNEKGQGIAINIDGEILSCTVKGSTMTIDDFAGTGMVVTLKK